MPLLLVLSQSMGPPSSICLLHVDVRVMFNISIPLLFDVGIIVVYVRMQRMRADRILLSGIVILRTLLVKPQILKKDF